MIEFHYQSHGGGSLEGSLKIDTGLSHAHTGCTKPHDTLSFVLI